MVTIINYVYSRRPLCEKQYRQVSRFQLIEVERQSIEVARFQLTDVERQSTEVARKLTENYRTT